MKIIDIIKEDAFQDFLSKDLSDIGGGSILDKIAGTDGKDDSSNKTSTSFVSAGGAVSPKEIKSYLLSRGFDNNQAAGLIVNIKWESHFKPGAYVSSDNHQGPSGGLMGFHDPKSDGRGNFSDMVAFCGGGNAWQTDWQKQLDFALGKQLGQKYKATKFSNPGEAAAWWVKNYEKPANISQQASARAKDAAQYA